jgi:HK97 gp10 family phage protein
VKLRAYFEERDIRQLAHRFEALQNVARGQTKVKAHLAGMTVLWELARRYVPKRTGNLHDAIKMRATISVAELYVDAVKANYWAFVEYGTRYMPAQPYIRPAIDTGQAQALRAMVKVLEADIRKAIK